MSNLRSALLLPWCRGQSHYTHFDFATLSVRKLENGRDRLGSCQPRPAHNLLSFGSVWRTEHAVVIPRFPRLTPSLFGSASYSFVVTQKDLLAMLDQELHGPILGLSILHFPRQTLRAHNSRREHNGHVLARHQVLRLLFHNPRQMEY